MGSIAPDMVTPADPANTAAVNLTAEDSELAGDYLVTVEGTATDSKPRIVEIAINIADAVPASPTLTMPVDDATGVKTLPTFSWSAVDQADSYVIEVATNAGFGNALVNDIANGTSYIPDSDLPIGTELFWRVTANNQCGPGATSAVFSFTTDEIGFKHGFESP